MTAIIEIEGLAKRYGDRIAVDGLDLEVREGDIYGFVGPNGAGKTSTIRILCTLLQADGGEVRVDGHSVFRAPREVRRVIGYMPDFFGVYDDMKVWEYLDFFGACYGIGPADRSRLVDDLLELVDLGHRREDFVEGLSRGMKQRLSLARTLVHDPKILILDEPASGLDPRARVEIRELLIELARMGKTIFFSTHILADVAQICTRIGIIEDGRLIAAGGIDELHQLVLPQKQVRLTALNAEAELEQLLSGQETVDEVRFIANGGEGRTRVEFAFIGDDDALGDMIAGLVANGVRLIRLDEDGHDLEEVFMRVTKGLSG
ncbi:MAG TPA: ABC transporter ATP-binding protein [Anaerolineales bacterium]|nr:ABC transporter ATP-binding protein [Anaerolineales bacterium]